MRQALAQWLTRIDMTEELAQFVACKGDHYIGTMVRVDLLLQQDVYVGNRFEYYLNTIAFSQMDTPNADLVKCRLENSEECHALCFIYLNEAYGLDVYTEVATNFPEYTDLCKEYYTPEVLENVIEREKEFLIHGTLEFVDVMQINYPEVDDIPVYVIQARQMV